MRTNVFAQWRDGLLENQMNFSLRTSNVISLGYWDISQSIEWHQNSKEGRDCFIGIAHIMQSLMEFQCREIYLRRYRIPDMPSFYSDPQAVQFHRIYMEV